jgi:hypothetical protein
LEEEGMDATQSGRPGSSLYDELADTPAFVSRGPRPWPGTMDTASIETIDNDQAMTLLTSYGIGE